MDECNYKVFYSDDDFEMGYHKGNDKTFVYCHTNNYNLSVYRKIIYRYSELKDLLRSDGVSEIFGIDTNNRTIRSIDKSSDFIGKILVDGVDYNMYRVDLCVTQ